MVLGIEARINDNCPDCNDSEFCKNCWNAASMEYEVEQLLNELKSDETLEITIATTDGEQWTYQTGDNSFMGSCYHYQFWGVGTLCKDTDCHSLAHDLVEQVFEQI